MEKLLKICLEKLTEHDGGYVNYEKVKIVSYEYDGHLCKVSFTYLDPDFYEESSDYIIINVWNILEILSEVVVQK